MRTSVDPKFLIERQGRQFALYAGLLDSAHQDAIGLSEIDTSLVMLGSEDNGQTWMFKATVTTKRGKFTSYGDASPANVSRQMLTCLPRMAETRAKARALRDAINAGALVSEEELEDVTHDSAETVPTPARPAPRQGKPTANPQGYVDTQDSALENAVDPWNEKHAVGGPTTPAPSRRELDAIQERELAEMGQHPPKVADGNGVTAPQLRAIYAIARSSKGWNEDQINETCKAQYHAKPGDLTRKQASDFITTLKGSVN